MEEAVKAGIRSFTWLFKLMARYVRAEDIAAPMEVPRVYIGMNMKAYEIVARMLTTTIHSISIS